MLLMRSAKFTPACPATYISAETKLGEQKEMNQHPAIKKLATNGVFFFIIVLPSYIITNKS
jgi:hypothetical protein